MQKVFIAGSPGTGKTFTGNDLSESYGWTHFDCELLHKSVCSQEFETFLDNPKIFLPEGEKIVVTWGFTSIFYPTVKKIVQLGFTRIWFDGEPGLRSGLLASRGESEATLIELLASPTEEAKNLFKPEIEIDVFDHIGNIRSCAAQINTNFYHV